MKKFPSNLLQTVEEFKAIKWLKTPEKIQNFLETIPINFEYDGETCRSPLRVLRERQAHCSEGAFLAAAIFWSQGKRPLVMELKTTNNDESHVIALFKFGRYWGAISKTNHAVLRYRDPIFVSIRELVMSYFNEYFLDDGRKTLRTYSDVLDLSQFGAEWLTSEKNLWQLDRALNKLKHFSVLPTGAGRNLRRADPLEIKAGKLVDWKKRIK